MKVKLFLFIAFLSGLGACCMAQDLRPKGKLVYFEYTDSLKSGLLFDNYKARQLSDERVEVFVYDYYDKFDSITVYGNRQPLDSIQRVINNWIEWFHPDGRRAHDRETKGRFLAIFDSGDTLLIPQLVWTYGMKDIQQYMKDYCAFQSTQMPLEELRGAIPPDAIWHDGSKFWRYFPRKGTQARRYKNASYEFLVFKKVKTGKVEDIWVRTTPSKKHDDIVKARLDMLSGIYQNETGKAVFGQFNSHEVSNSDPGSDLRIRCKYSYDGVLFTDTIDWGFKRIQKVNPPKDAPPGWGGAGAFSGPTTWTVRFTKDGLHVEEVETGINCPTEPAFGKVFNLKKIRGPYWYSSDPWAITLAQPITKGQLSILSTVQLREMLEEFDQRHADGSKPTELEQLNKSFIQTYLSRQKAK